MSVDQAATTMKRLQSSKSQIEINTNLKKRSQFDIWKSEAAERQRRQREEDLRIARQKILDEEEMKRKVGDEACWRIEMLPKELQIYILHQLEVKQLQLLQLPPSTLRAVLQAGEKDGAPAKELVKSTWNKRILDKDDKIALHTLGKKAKLLPDCPVAKPSPYWHRCKAFCAWEAPDGGWDVFHATKHQKCSRFYGCIDFE